MNTDNELKQLLAKMLPETFFIGFSGLLWTKDGKPVLDTELLHLCSLVEAGLTEADLCWYYNDALFRVVCGHPENSLALDFAKVCSANWQQRTTALAATKGVL